MDVRVCQKVCTVGHIVSAALWVGRLGPFELTGLLAGQAQGLARHAGSRENGD